MPCVNRVADTAVEAGSTRGTCVARTSLWQGLLGCGVAPGFSVQEESHTAPFLLISFFVSLIIWENFLASVGRNEKIFIFFERDRKNEKKRKENVFHGNLPIHYRFRYQCERISTLYRQMNTL